MTGSRLEGALAARDLEAGEVLIDLVDDGDRTEQRTRTVLERIPKGARIALRPGGWLTPATTPDGDPVVRHCHADGAGPCLAADCPIAALGPVVLKGRRLVRACPGAEGPQHPAEQRRPTP